MLPGPEIRQTKISPVRSDFNVKGHLHIEKVLVLSQVTRHLLLSVGDVLLQLTYPYLWMETNIR